MSATLLIFVAFYCWYLSFVAPPSDSMESTIATLLGMLVCGLVGVGLGSIGIDSILDAGREPRTEEKHILETHRFDADEL